MCSRWPGRSTASTPPEACAASRCSPLGRCWCPTPTFRCTSSSPATAPSPTLDLDAQPGRPAYQAAILSPLGPMDIQALLEENRPDGRLRQLHALLEDARDLLSRRIVEG